MAPKGQANIGGIITDFQTKVKSFLRFFRVITSLLLPDCTSSMYNSTPPGGSRQTITRQQAPDIAENRTNRTSRPSQIYSLMNGASSMMNYQYAIRYTLYASRSALRQDQRAQKNLFMQNKPNLPNAQILVNCVLTMDYVNIHLRSRFKNKAKQTQFKANSKPISERPK